MAESFDEKLLAVDASTSVTCQTFSSVIDSIDNLIDSVCSYPDKVKEIMAPSHETSPNENTQTADSDATGEVNNSNQSETPLKKSSDSSESSLAPSDIEANQLGTNPLPAYAKIRYENGKTVMVFSGPIELPQDLTKLWREKVANFLLYILYMR